MPAASRQSEKQKPRKRKTHPPRSIKGTRRGRPTAYCPSVAQKICAIIAAGASFAKALAQLGINERTGFRWASADPDFRQDLMRARELRGDFTFGEQLLDIADDGSNDWIEAKNGGAPRVNKELVLRSKLRIEARQFHMSHLHPPAVG
jgi:hypothetical protein